MMIRQQPDLTLNGLRLPLPIGAEIQQSYEAAGGFALLRLASGAAVPQQAWRRLRTTVSARGIALPGLAAVDWLAPITLGCVAARSIQAAGRVIGIPGAQRADAAAYGWAITPEGLLRPTPVSVSEGVATLAPVAGAAGYQVLWYPLLTVYAVAGVQESYDAVGAAAGWEITFEEA